MNPDQLYLLNNLGAAGNGVGDVANVLLTAGRSLSDVSQVLQSAINGGLMPQEKQAMAQQELAWVQYQARQDSQQKTLLLFGAALVIGWLVLRDN